MNRIPQLMEQMTTEEKIGQLTQIGTSIYTDDDVANERVKEQIRQGRIGSFLSVAGVDKLNGLQRIAVEESRLGIPLFFGHDIIHGYRTIFPVPAGEACSFEPELAYQSSKVAAAEMRAAGIHATWAPMVDIARDQRWGRGLEGSGEDVYLSCELAKERVRGFQNSDLSDKGAVAACAKHLIGYGAVEGGRDYNDADISENRLYNIYFPPFRACIEEDVAFIMTAFHALNGIPCTTDKKLLRDITRKEMGFDGIFISDAGSLEQTIVHGYAKDGKEAAKLGLEAGLDVEMFGVIYDAHLKELVESQESYRQLLDEAVFRVLKLKVQLGLFDHPYTDASKTDGLMLRPESVALSRKIAARSMVLLENNGILPLRAKKVAVIGKLADSKETMLGKWVCAEYDEAERAAVTVLDAFQTESSIEKFTYAPAYDFLQDVHEMNAALKQGRYSMFSTTDSLVEEAVRAAEEADVILFVAGECNLINGEAKSRADLSVPEVEMQVFRKLHELGKPIVTLIVAGRPLLLDELKEKSDALMFTYNLGSQMGNAVADVMFGRYNPSAKLVNTFPSANGQCPTMYYSHNNTGKPYHPDIWYSTKYVDVPEEPLYPFGYGKSYTEFSYGNLQTDKKQYRATDKILLTVTVENIGDCDGEEVIQVYMRDLVGKVVRPVKQLVDFQKQMIKKGEKKTVSFEIACQKLGYYYQKEWICEAGEFILFVGGNSKDTIHTEIEIM